MTVQANAPATAVTPNADNRLFRFDSKTPQRCVGAAALLLVSSTLFAILWPLRYSLLAAWFVIELIFYIFYWRPRYNELNRQPPKHEPVAVDGERLFQRFLQFCKDMPQGVDYKGYFSLWFKGVPFADVKRENAEEFMAYGFWYRTRERMAELGLGALPARMVDQLEATWGIRFEPGYNPNVEFMGHLWEPLNASWRPLTFYLCTEGVGYFARQLLKRWGFQHHKHNGLSYFTLNVRPQRAAPTASASRATSCTALTELAQGVPPPPQQQQQQQQPPAAAVAAGSVSSAASLSQRSASRIGSALMRAKSSPFEAGPPDWTPFAEPGSADACASRDASVLANEASPSAVRSATAPAHCLNQQLQQLQQQQQQQQPHQKLVQRPEAAHAAAAPRVPPILSGHSSALLRSTNNPLQGALSDGLGSADTPVLFLHGVGGLPAYLEMLLYVVGLGHPVIAVEFKGVSMRLGKVYVADEVADTVIGILDKLGVKEACVVGHSYGTFIAGLLARRYRKRVHALCLIDPVCFGMFMPHLLYNFLYRVPSWRGWGLHNIIEYVKDAGRLVASREVHVCTTFARGFFWSDLNLWPEDLQPGSVVLLSGKDDLMDAAEVKDMLDVAGHVKVMYNHELTHGAFLLDTEVKQAIMAEVRGLLARSGSAVVGLARPVLVGTLTLMTHGFGSHSGAVRMKRGGANGRYYVEDHGNQLVRTFTGNLTKMLASVGGLRGSGDGSGLRPRTGTGGGVAGSAQAHHPSAGGTAGAARAGTGESRASRLMQTFSGPVRKRFHGRAWGGTVDGEGSADMTAAFAAAGGSGSAMHKGMAMGGGNSGRGRGGSGSGGGRAPPSAKRDGAAAVERIDEGEAAEEQ